jgi:bifunctional DNase/RNase
MQPTMPGLGLLALPTLLAAGVAAVAADAPLPPRGDPIEMVEMEVLGVRPLEDDQGSLLLLREKGADAVLPLVIGRAEGNAIELPLRKAVPPRPMTHDLLGRAIGELGGKVLRVEIDGFRDSVFLAKVRVAQGDRSLSLDARPSDSVALALRTKAPIYAARKVITAAGLSRSELERMKQGREPRRPKLPSEAPPPFEGAQRL